jgi:hypothetical protein
LRFEVADRELHNIVLAILGLDLFAPLGARFAMASIVLQVVACGPRKQHGPAPARGTPRTNLRFAGAFDGASRDRTGDLLLAKQEPALRPVASSCECACKSHQSGCVGATGIDPRRQSGAPLMHPGPVHPFRRAAPPHNVFTIGAGADGRPDCMLAVDRGPTSSLHACRSFGRGLAASVSRAAVIAVSALICGIPSSSSMTCP